MKPQSLKRKLKVFAHCLFRWHRRGAYPWRRESETRRYWTWVCATCAEKIVKPREALTPDDIQWANEAIKRHPEWNALATR